MEFRIVLITAPCSLRGNYVHLSWSRVKNTNDQSPGLHLLEKLDNSRLFCFLCFSGYTSFFFRESNNITLNDVLCIGWIMFEKLCDRCLICISNSTLYVIIAWKFDMYRYIVYKLDDVWRVTRKIIRTVNLKTRLWVFDSYFFRIMEILFHKYYLPLLSVSFLDISFYDFMSRIASFLIDFPSRYNYIFVP